MHHPFTFPKEEHLFGEITVSRLFTQGKAFIAYPFRVVYILESNDSESTARVLISVPKKKFKRAVKRNRIKRLIRESYRLNKQQLIDRLNERGLQVQFAFNYVADDELDFATFDKKMKMALTKLSEKIVQDELHENI
jgi:ribonuclease P protein component